jgi:hypothetical protein
MGRQKKKRDRTKPRHELLAKRGGRYAVLACRVDPHQGTDRHQATQAARAPLNVGVQSAQSRQDLATSGCAKFIDCDFSATARWRALRYSLVMRQLLLRCAATRAANIGFAVIGGANEEGARIGRRDVAVRRPGVRGRFGCQSAAMPLAPVLG